MSMQNMGTVAQRTSQINAGGTKPGKISENMGTKLPPQVKRIGQGYAMPKGFNGGVKPGKV